MAHTSLVLDIPATIQSLVRGRTDLFAVTEAFLAGYASVLPLEDAEAALLGDLLAGRMAQTILISAWRMPQHPDNEYIRGWAGPAWELLEQMEAIGFDEVIATNGGTGAGADRRERGTARICWGDADGSWAARSSRCRTGRRCTSCAAMAPGWRPPTSAATSMPTTTSRWSATRIRGSLRRSRARRPR